MSKTLIITGILLMMLKPSLYSQMIIKQPSSKIKSVKVYDGWAEITRTFSCPLTIGDSRIEVQNPAKGVLLKTITIRSTTKNSQYLSHLSIVRSTIIDEAKNLSKEEAQIKLLKSKIKEIEIKTLGLQNGFEMVEKLKKFFLKKISKETSKKKIDFQSWTLDLALLKNNALLLTKKSRQLELQKWTLQNEINLLQIALKQNQKTTRTNSLFIFIDTNSKKKGVATFELKYLVKGPSWRPEYDFNYDLKTNRLQLNYFAKIKQETNEDWSNVELIVTTENLKQSIQLPKKPQKLFRLDKVENSRPKLKMSREKIGQIIVKERNETAIKKKLLFNDNKKESANNHLDQIKNSNGFQSGLNDDGVRTEFHIGKATLPSTNRIQKVLILEKVTPSQVIIELTPSYQTEAYRRLSLTNNTNSIFLPGDAHLYLEGRPLGKTKLPLLRPTEKFSMSYGIVIGLYGSKEIQSLTKKEQRKITHKRKHIKYQFSIRSFSNLPMTIRIFETIPISKLEAVKVIFDLEKSVFKFQNPGLLYYDVTIKPNQRIILPIEYFLNSKGKYTF